MLVAGLEHIEGVQRPPPIVLVPPPPCRSLATLSRRFQPAKLQFSRMPAEEQQDENNQASSDRRGRKRKPRVQRWRLKVIQVANLQFRVGIKLHTRDMNLT